MHIMYITDNTMFHTVYYDCLAICYHTDAYVMMVRNSNAKCVQPPLYDMQKIINCVHEMLAYTIKNFAWEDQNKNSALCAI